MPSRPISALIVLFWFGTLGWFGYRDVWPKFRPGEAPPFVIELADEATSQLPNENLRPADALWQIYRGDTNIGSAQTRLRYLKADDTFELETRVVGLKLMGDQIEIPQLTNSYRLNRAGELRGIQVKGKMIFFKLYTGDAEFEAAVHGDALEWTGKIRLPVYGTIEPKLEPIAAPRGIFLNPMHPVPRVKGLRPGRQWQMPVVNPMADIVGPVFQAIQLKIKPGAKPIALKIPTEARSLAAEVLTETASLPFDNRAHECLIIEYRNENETFRTYVRKSDGMVLRQESQALGERIYLHRQ